MKREILKALFLILNDGETGLHFDFILM